MEHEFHKGELANWRYGYGSCNLRSRQVQIVEPSCPRFPEYVKIRYLQDGVYKTKWTRRNRLRSISPRPVLGGVADGGKPAPCEPESKTVNQS